MSENPARMSRKAYLLSSGQLLLERQMPEPRRAGTPQMYHNGLGRYFVGRPVFDNDGRVHIEYAPDPDRILELAATEIRRNKFGSYTYDQENVFPVTRRLAFAAFPDLRPKNYTRP